MSDNFTTRFPIHNFDDKLSNELVAKKKLREKEGERERGREGKRERERSLVALWGEWVGGSTVGGRGEAAFVPRIN